MSPLACVQSLVYAFLFGELTDIATLLSSLSTDARIALLRKLAVNGTLAFALNYVSFMANKKTSPLTMTVAGNLKQCLSIILGVWIFRIQVGWMNALGIIVALVGGAWYAKIEFSIKSVPKAEDQGLLKTDEKEVV